MGDRVASRDGPFVLECLRFLRAKTGVDGPPSGLPLAPETAAAFFRVLMQTVPQLLPELGEELRATYAAAAAARLSGSGAPGGGLPLEASTPDSPFSKEVEEEANGYFQKIYTGQQSIADVVELLRGFQASAVKHEKDVFSCMLHNLFDEYRYFNKYPDKARSCKINVLFNVQSHLPDTCNCPNQSSGAAHHSAPVWQPGRSQPGRRRQPHPGTALRVGVAAQGAWLQAARLWLRRTSSVPAAAGGLAGASAVHVIC